MDYGNLTTIVVVLISAGIAVGVMKSTMKSITDIVNDHSKTLRGLSETSIRRKGELDSFNARLEGLDTRLNIAIKDCDEKFKHVEDSLNFQVKSIRDTIEGFSSIVSEDQEKTRKYQSVLANLMLTILAWIGQQNRKSGSEGDGISDMIATSRRMVEDLISSLTETAYNRHR